jgi:hypothetical protein
MNKYRAIFLVSIAIFINGCGPTAEGFAKLQDTWVGASEIELVRVWGVPTSTYTSGGSKFLVYSHSATSKDNYQSNVDYWGNVNTINYGGNEYSCEVTYEFSNKRIKYISWKGNNCLYDEKNL